MPPPRNRLAIRRRCTRSLSLSPPRLTSPRAVLTHLAASITDEVAADRYGEGELVQDFERQIAELLGKEAAVFMPSGTMAQVIALRLWSERKRCPTVAFHPLCHLELHEQKSYQFLHGLRSRWVGEPAEPMTLADLEAVREPVAALLVELPQRELGGTLPTWKELTALSRMARARGMALHLDGARLWESQPFYGRPHAAIASLFDSVYVSLYKGLGGLAGCMLAGAADFIAEARIWQRRQGGELPAQWPYVLAAKVGFSERLVRIPRYVARARSLAQQLARLDGVRVAPAHPPTSMFHLFVQGDRLRLENAALDVAAETRVWITGHVAATAVPDLAKFEITCEEGSLELSDDEVVALFENILSKAGRGTGRGVRRR